MENKDARTASTNECSSFEALESVDWKGVADLASRYFEDLKINAAIASMLRQQEKADAELVAVFADPDALHHLLYRDLIRTFGSILGSPDPIESFHNDPHFHASMACIANLVLRYLNAQRESIGGAQ